MTGLRLAAIPPSRYEDYRRDVIFGAYKWDPMVSDSNTVARQALLISPETAAELEQMAVALTQETLAMENALLRQLPLVRALGLPLRLRRALLRTRNYDPQGHVRLMRFDLHPTEAGWQVSEVNSDVPGGLAEASVLPEIAAPYFPGFVPGVDFGQRFLAAHQYKLPPGGTVAFVHATSYSDDRQVMEFLADRFEAAGYRTLMAAPDHLRWENRRAVSLIFGHEGPVDAIVRFFPLEWLPDLPRRADWRGYFDTETLSCNHPAAIVTQSKRLPLVWDRLELELPTWRRLLPETRDPRQAKGEGWIYKPAMGRVGEGISIREAMSPKEYRSILRAVKRYPKDWTAQRRFTSVPLETEEGERFHLCVGVFTVDGQCAGFYGRISPGPRIDSKAKDIPILVSKEGVSL